jgi:hypothetical protein
LTFLFGDLTKMLKRPTPDPGAFFKLHNFLEQRKLKRPARFGVIVFGLLQNLENHNGFPLHGIFWLCDVFDTYEEAKKLVDEIIENTGMSHVKVLSLGTSDLLTTAVDPTKSRTIIDTKKIGVIESIERQNIREHIDEKKDQERIDEIIAEERLQLDDPESEVHYGHIWMRYIQNRSIREQTENMLKEYIKLEKDRLGELRKLQKEHPKYEETWLPVFSEYRIKLDEKAAAGQIEDLWIKYRSDVFPQIWDHRSNFK